MAEKKDFGCVGLVGVAPRDRSCTRRDRTGGGAIALTRWGEMLLRSYARFGPVPLLLGCRDVGGVGLGIGWWRAGFWLWASCGGGSAGQVLHSQGSLGRRAFALTRWGNGCYDPMLVSALSRCCLGVGMLVGFVWGQAGGERDFGCVRLGGGSAGPVLHSQGSLGRRGFRADALGGSVATILCSFRSCPADAAFYGVVGKELLQNGLWVVYEATQTTLPP